MAQAMIDIETLDTRPSAVVLSVGWAIFDKKLLDDGEVHLDIEAQIQAGRTIAGSTLVWWMEQDEAVRKSVFAGGGSIKGLAVLLQSLGETYRVDQWWANSPNFDMVILESLLPRVPWKYYELRDVRTLGFLRKTKMPKNPNAAHSAKSDAIHQARWVMEMLSED